MSRKSTTTLPPEIPGIAGLNQDDKNIVMSFPPISQSIKKNIKSLKILNRKMEEAEAADGLVQLSKKQKNKGGKTRNKRRGKRSNKTRRRKSCK